MADVVGSTASFRQRFDDAVQAAEQAYAYVHNAICKLTKAPPLAVIYGSIAFVIIFLIGVAYALVTSFVIASLAPIATAVLKIISDVRKAGLPELNEIAAQSMGELLGVDFDVSNLTPQGSPDAALESARRLGKLLHDRLIAEFVGPDGATPKSGEAAAQAFSGYVTRFGVSNAMLSVLADSLSLHHLTQFRELGVEVANNLGLGRMHRRAIQPLIDATISKPYTRELSERYRPDRLSDVQYIKAFQSGRIDAARLKQELVHKGYRDIDIDELIQQLQARATDAELETLVRWSTGAGRPTLLPPTNGQLGLNDIGKVSTGDAVTQMVNQGMSEELARQKLVARGLTRGEGEVSNYINRIETLVAHKDIDIDQARSLLQGLPLSPAELEFRMATMGLRLEYPRTSLTLAQLEQGFADGYIDLDYIDRWLDAEGYSNEDQLFLTFRIILFAEKKLDKEKAAADRKVRLASKPHK